MPVDPYLTDIQATYFDLEGWQARARRMPPEQPERGSELALDDAVFKWHPISESVRLSLVTSGEHLRLARDAIESGQVYPSAHFTVLRGALVGAAQAVWILAPETGTERQQRGLTLLAEMYKQLRKFDAELNTFFLEPEQRNRLRDQQIWLHEREAQVAAQRASQSSLNQTEFIRWSLEYLFQDEERRQDGRTLWRQMSADAHVLGWSIFQRASLAPTGPPSDLTLGAAGGSLKNVAQPFMASYRLLKEGWSLFDRRCEGRFRSNALKSVPPTPA